MSSYTTMGSGAEVTAEVERRRSRFLAVLARASSVEAAEELPARLRRRHHEARHHCCAWVVGPEREQRRGDDDGEPSGTAGAPMLEALSRATMPSGAADLSDVVVVVVRWFGGTLLGAGGLVSAYSDATTAVLLEAAEGGHLVTRRRLRRHAVLAPITEAGRWENELRGHGVLVEETDYTAGGTLAGIPAAELRLAVADTEAESARLHELLASLSSGEAELRAREAVWTDLP
ncbi:MAG: YigZ family protein [Nesterenkonia sp.]|nr:YigZ family protein [Nesterenkonia sp.]